MIPNTFAKKLINVETAHCIVRHITSPLADSLVSQLKEFLENDGTLLGPHIGPDRVAPTVDVTETLDGLEKEVAKLKSVGVRQDENMDENDGVPVQKQVVVPKQDVRVLPASVRQLSSMEFRSELAQACASRSWCCMARALVQQDKSQGLLLAGLTGLQRRMRQLTEVTAATAASMAAVTIS